MTTLLPPGFCLNCGHAESAHVLEGRRCEVEVRDYGELDCTCPGLRLCAACEGDPEAHDLHVCGRGGLLTNAIATVMMRQPTPIPRRIP